MYANLINLGLGFLEGFALIISPCILPILPIILAGSFTGGRKRPMGIITGFILAFSLFTFFSRQLVEYSGIDLNLIRHFSYGILFLLGLMMMSNWLSEKFSLLTQGLAKYTSNLSLLNKPQGDFAGGLVFGGLVAFIWTPCAGPILAAVIVQTVIEQTNWMSLLTLLAFATGAALPMFLIALFGRNIMPQFGFFKTHTVLFRKLLGVIIIAAVVYLLYSEGALSLTSTTVPNTVSQSAQGLTLKEGLAQPYSAPSIGGISAWLNSEPLTLSDLKGKVVLIDFWTYSCINCLRTLPYLKDWYAKYHDKGLVIIGMHSPEFDFEKNLNNVKAAIEKEGIKYAVALDNQFVTWRNYNNRYWPAHYLINKQGEVVYTHFGEGDYDTTENNIRFLLGLNKPLAATSTSKQAYVLRQTPETYLGYERAEQFSSPETLAKNQIKEYSLPQTLGLNAWALQGPWIIYSDRIVSEGTNSVLELHFIARKVFIVMGNKTQKPLSLKLLLNGKPLSSQKGKDVTNSSIEVTQPRLYDALVLDRPSEGILQLFPSGSGIEIYTFTFGN